ncbi:NUDIX domain-containing protein [Isoptericola sp. b441]|uniref:NUDIX domain-containing protein n=1 Tax=Actinotalea lenta TaxID=3064654 RepID=A0ABT9DB41_9CELL|nr:MULTISPECIES: NUDIX domain-containing protein [unclassified Isoptericola]MDO8106423.1 NUDIX domain-containing protein [Isoptericola sp. b441]MDO8121872.1 NUDIX domain-containing protein [Isoptericola sp. b490]
MPVPEFVLRLRDHVGTDPLWLPGVSAVVIDGDGQVLLGRRADNGRWAVVSGILEPGEEPGVAVARECREETGVEVEVLALTSVACSEPVVYPNGDRAQYLDVCFWCRPVAGEARVADDESTDVGWFPPDALPEPLNPSTRERIDRTLAHMAALDAGRPHGPYFAR